MRTDVAPIITFKCVPVTQPIGTFYVGAIGYEDLIEITWTDVREIASKKRDPTGQDECDYAPPSISPDDDADFRIEELDEDYKSVYEQNFEEFLGIQRQLSRGRVREISQYVENVDAAFPTAVLLAVSSQQARYDEVASTMSIVRHQRAAKVIDGQHRIEGLKNFSGDVQFDVNVSVFIDMDIQDQAMVFATINLGQTKVNRSLAYDLYELTRSRSPQKTAHDIVRFLNNTESSPFHEKIKMLGAGSGLQTITQATFVDRLLRYISSNPMKDRDQLRRGRKLEKASVAAKNRQIFRDFFIEERDAQLIVILWIFFEAVQNKWPDSWNNIVPGNILNRTTGFSSLMRFLRVAYRSIGKPSQVVSRDDFQRIIERIELRDREFTSEKYLPGGSGERSLFDELVELSGLEDYK